MWSCKTRKKSNGKGRALKASCRHVSLLLLGVAWVDLGVAQEVAQNEEWKARPQNSGLEFFTVKGAVDDRLHELEDTYLEDVRGRFAPVAEFELDRPWGIILWDEGKGSRTGSGPGTSQTQSGSNQQRQSMSITTVR